MLGSDFESFLTKSGEIIPATGLGLPGKKLAPVLLEDEYGPAGSIHRDNVMIEICTLPSHTAEEFANNTRRALQAGYNWVKSKDKELGISAAASCIFNSNELNNPYARELGCDIDYISNHYLSQERERITPEDIGHSRFSGAHVHISYEETDLPAWLAACMCDLFIGLPHSSNLDKDRAKFYGSLSLHRPTTYPDGTSGVEYRPMDNFWIHDDRKRLSVAKGAEMVEQVLNLGDQDVIRELHRVHTDLPKMPLVSDFGNDTAAKYYVEKAHRIWKEACG